MLLPCNVKKTCKFTVTSCQNFPENVGFYIYIYIYNSVILTELLCTASSLQKIIVYVSTVKIL